MNELKETKPKKIKIKKQKCIYCFREAFKDNLCTNCYKLFGKKDLTKV